MRLPHPLLLLLSGVVLAAALTWVLPAGAFERREDQATGREVVVPGTYARVAPTPVGPWGALLAVPQGIIEGADVIVVVLFVGGAFVLLDSTGALRRLVGALVGRTRRPRIVVAVVSLAFASLGALENMHEEIVALIPIVLVLSRGLGFGAVTAVGMSLGAAAVGAAYGPTNPFQTGIALRFAELPPLSQPALRFALFAVAVVVWIGWTLVMTSRDDVKPAIDATSTEHATGRDVLMLLALLLPFVPYVFGVIYWDWGFNELSALFLVAAFAVGLIAGRGLGGTSADLLESMEALLGAALFVGIARAISVVLTNGQIIDTIVYGLAAPLATVPAALAMALMIPVHALIHVPVVSVSGQAVLTMPIMAPLADLLGVSRDAAVIAYQTGAGLMDMLTPTNGALLAILLGAGVSYGRWLRFAVPGAMLVALVGLAGMLIAG